MSKLAQDINSVGAELFEGRLAQDINSVDAELVQETTVLSLTAPANGQTGVALSMTFSWTDSESRGLYRLLYDKDINFGSPTEVWTESTSHNATLTSGTYYWKVEAHNTVQQPAIPTGTIQNDSEAGDIESLQLFYDNLGGASWTDNTGWASTGMTLDTAPFGITTAEIGGETRVTEIDLQANNLIGSIPEFPGLQECNVFLVKQAESGMSSPPERITGEIPRSLGQTKITQLSLCGRTPNDYRTATGNFYNKKNGKAWNQFSGSLPSELYSLTLTFLEIDGLDGQFNGTLDSRCGNWRLDRFLATGNVWYSNLNNPPLSVGSFTGEIPSEIKNWDSQILLIEDNAWTGIALDAFEGWTEKDDRWIMVGNDGGGDEWLWDQELPTITFGNFAKFSWGGRLINGAFPNQFFQGIGGDLLYEFSLGTHDFSGNVQAGLLANFGTTLRFSLPQYFFGTNDLSGTLIDENEDVAGYFGNRVILFYLQGNESLNFYVSNGLHEWYSARVLYMNDLRHRGTLPARPPAMYGPSLIQLRLDRRAGAEGPGLTGPIPADWGKVGSGEEYGGNLTSGTITGFGEDATGFYIEDSNASFTVNEFQPETSTANGPILRHPTSTFNSSRRVISNTATRIYYATVTINENEIGFTDLANGNNYFVSRNTNTDVRRFNSGFSLANQNLSGTLLEESIPTAMSGGTYNIEGNKFTIKDFVDNIQAWLDVAENTTGDAVMSASASEGDTSIFVDDGAGGASTNTISAGDYIFIRYGGSKEHRYIVDSISGNEITFTTALVRDYDDNSEITNGWNFAYASQQKFGENQSDINIDVGGFFEIDFSSFSASGADYTWTKDGVELADSSPVLQRSNAQESDTGLYVLEITHPNVPNMTSTSIDVNVTVSTIE